MRRQRMIAAVILTALLFTGCTSLSLSGSDLLAPPLAAGHRAEVQHMIEQDAKGSYTLLYPTSGAYKSGMILHDINNDGTDEAIALYTAADNTPRLLMAIKQNENYTLYGSTSLPSANISRLDFADIDADGKEELVLGFDLNTPMASVKAFVNGDELSVAEGFTDYTVGDFDGNSASDILLMTRTDDKNAHAALMIFADGTFSEKSVCEIDPLVQSYVDLRFDKISESMNGAIADGKRENGEYTTQLLYYDSAAHMLVNPLFLNSSYSQSVRTSAITCNDIDGDGIIEIPVCNLMPSAKGEKTDTVCSLVRWSDYDAEDMALAYKQNAVLCEKLGFMLYLAGDLSTSVTARYTADNAVTLYALSYDKNNEPVIGGELLTVKRYDQSSFDSSLTAEAALFESTADIYTYILSEGSPFTHEDVKNSFKLLGADTVNK